jgi:hypothetical protein
LNDHFFFFNTKRMKNLLLFLCPFLLFSTVLFAQDDELIRVKAGTKVSDYFPPGEKYRFQDFTGGMLVLKNGLASPARFNYNFLSGEMDFLKSGDTLSIINKKDISYIAIAQDTFYYKDGYIELIAGGPVKVGKTRYVRLKDIERKGALGMTDRNSSIDTYSSVPSPGNLFELIPNEDWVLEKKTDYYLSAAINDFVFFTKNNVMKLFPQKKKAIMEYLKSNKVNFRSQDDLLVLAKYLGEL